MKVSFDFDSCLSEDWVQSLAKNFLSIFEVWIVTSREEGNSHNVDLYKISDRLGISRERIIFTNGAYKWSSLNYHGIDLHFDDMEDEIIEINNKTKCKGILIGLKDAGELWYLFNNK